MPATTQDNSKSTGRIFTKFCVHIGNLLRKNWLNFGDDLKQPVTQKPWKRRVGGGLRSTSASSYISVYSHFSCRRLNRSPKRKIFRWAIIGDHHDFSVFQHFRHCRHNRSPKTKFLSARWQGIIMISVFLHILVIADPTAVQYGHFLQDRHVQTGVPTPSKCPS